MFLCQYRTTYVKVGAGTGAVIRIQEEKFPEEILTALQHYFKNMKKKIALYMYVRVHNTHKSLPTEKETSENKIL